MSKYGLADHELKNYAEALQNSPLLQGLMKEMQDTAFVKWNATSPPDQVIREEAWYEYRAVDTLVTMIDNTLAELAAVTDPQRK